MQTVHVFKFFERKSEFEISERYQSESISLSVGVKKKVMQADTFRMV